MRRALVVTAVVGLSFAAGGCFSHSKTQEPALTAAPLPGPAWQLTLRSACAEGTDDSQCVGKYGFTVLADGKYQVGPGPAGQTLEGALSAEELQTLNQDINAAGGPQLAETARAEGHVTAEAAPASDDTLVLTRANRSQTIIRNVAAETYFQTATADTAAALHAAIRTLAEKYYVLPFPNPCTDASNAVAALYAGLQTCSQDADCAYVDAQTYEALPPTSVAYVIADNCSTVHPLIVANRLAVADSQQKLVDALSNAQGVCGYEMIRSDCQISGFTASAPAVCQSGKCRVNPTLGTF